MLRLLLTLAFALFASSALASGPQQYQAVTQGSIPMHWQDTDVAACQELADSQPNVLLYDWVYWDNPTPQCGYHDAANPSTGPYHLAQYISLCKFGGTGASARYGHDSTTNNCNPDPNPPVACVAGNTSWFDTGLSMPPDTICHDGCTYNQGSAICALGVSCGGTYTSTTTSCSTPTPGVNPNPGACPTGTKNISTDSTSLNCITDKQTGGTTQTTGGTSTTTGGVTSTTGGPRQTTGGTTTVTGGAPTITPTSAKVTGGTTSSTSGATTQGGETTFNGGTVERGPDGSITGVGGTVTNTGGTTVTGAPVVSQDIKLDLPTDYARETTMDGVRTGSGAPDLPDQDAVVTAAKTQGDTDLKALRDGVTGGVDADKSSFFSWVWTPPSGTCAPFTGEVHGFAISWDLCPTIYNIRDVLGWLFALLAAIDIYGQVFRRGD